MNPRKTIDAQDNCSPPADCCPSHSQTQKRNEQRKGAAPHNRWWQGRSKQLRLRQLQPTWTQTLPMHPHHLNFLLYTGCSLHNLAAETFCSFTFQGPEFTNRPSLPRAASLTALPKAPAHGVWGGYVCIWAQPRVSRPWLSYIIGVVVSGCVGWFISLTSDLSYHHKHTWQSLGLILTQCDCKQPHHHELVQLSQFLVKSRHYARPARLSVVRCCGNRPCPMRALAAGLRNSPSQLSLA